MRGLLKTKPAINQFLVLFGIILVSLFFVGGIIGNLLAMAISGVKLSDIEDILKTDFNKPGVLTYYRGLQVVQFFVLCIPAFICSWLFSENDKKYLGLKKSSDVSYYLAGIAIILLAIPFANLLGELNKNFPFPSSWATWMKAGEEKAAFVQSAMLSEHTITNLLINIVIIAATAGFSEELLFRGVLQRILIKMFKSPWAGIIVAAFLFSAMHMQFYGFLPRFVLGILLGAAYWYSGSLWVSILAHFVYDAALITMIYNKPELMNDAAPFGANELLIAGLVSAGLVSIILFWMKKKSVTKYAEVYGDDAVPVKNHPF